MANIEHLRQQLETANARHRMGDIAAALPAYRAILNDWPNQPDALHMLGVIAQQMGHTQLAAQLFDETVKVAPQFAVAWVNRAILLRLNDDHGEAQKSVDRALKLEPRLASAWNMSGILLRDNRRYDEARSHHARAVELDPESANFQQNYAAVLLALGRFHEAWKAARIAEVSDPHRADTLTVLGNILSAAGYPERAIPYYHKAQKADARYVDAISSEATTCLYMGDFVRGWELMEGRRLYLHDNRCQSLKRWRGEAVSHLLLTAEQGAGDTIQALRYIPYLKTRVEHLTLEVPEALERLIAFSFPDIPLITPKHDLVQADAFEPLMSLPYHCLEVLKDIPAPLSYLRTNPAWSEPWVEKLSKVPHPRVGFVWAGNPQQINDYNRSLPFELMKPLLALAETHAIAVQKSAKPYDIPATSFDAAPLLGDYADTAALFEELDLLITVDTSTAHLMGALGKPVWTLIPFDPGWRYLIGRRDSPWYPSMRLFRQPSPGDWKSVVTEVKGELEKYLLGDQSVLKPQRWTEPSLRQHPEALNLTG